MADLRYMQKPVHSIAQIHKGTIHLDGDHSALYHIANLQSTPSLNVTLLG